MKLFDGRRNNIAAYKAARDHAAEGGQALHVWDPDPADYPDAPGVFKRNRPWAHLLDQDLVRLQRTARELGVKVIKVGHPKRKSQHIDLCGKPLERAVAECCCCDRPTNETECSVHGSAVMTKYAELREGERVYIKDGWAHPACGFPGERTVTARSVEVGDGVYRVMCKEE
jgi:hypothetical protein